MSNPFIRMGLWGFYSMMLSMFQFSQLTPKKSNKKREAEEEELGKNFYLSTSIGRR